MDAAKQVPNYPQKSPEHAIVAVDVVIFTVVDGALKVLLLELQEEPFAGKWALPGGLVRVEESLDEAARRHLKTKAGLADIYLEQLYTFGAVNRDPKGRVISVAYMAVVPEGRFEPQTSPRYKQITWRAISDLPRLAYDHSQIIAAAVERLRNKLGYTNIAYSLLPNEFTLSQLQRIYELILGKMLDKRNFRKKILAVGLLKELSKMTTGQASRPAQLYEFMNKSPIVVEIL